MSLRPLPARFGAWSRAVLNAYSKLNAIYQTARAYVDSDGLEGHRLRQYGTAIITDAYPLLILIEDCAESEGLPSTWVHSTADQFTELLALVDEKWVTAEGQASAGVHIPEVVTEVHGHTGRPKKVVHEAVLRDVFNTGRNIPQTELARILGIDRKTLKKRLDELNIDIGYSDISDANLDALIKEYHDQNPTGGRGYVTGWLRSTHGLHVQRDRIRASMVRTDRLGHALRQTRNRKTPRQKYKVPRPNALWHIDGHHKLNLWGFVIHGIADGYSRKITGLRASTNNAARTVLDMFIEAVTEHGIPSRVRGDRGGENRDVSILMILLRGLHRASFMWGPSVFNTRIERIWVELGERFGRQWKAFFFRLENRHLLQRANSSHRWLLHHLFLDMINDDCDSFCSEWNAHPVSGRGGGRSPNELAYLGALEHGVYVDECQDLAEEEVYDYYGIPFTETIRDLENDIEDRDVGDDSDSDSEDTDSEDNTSDSDLDNSETDGSDETEAEYNYLGFDPVEVIDSNIRHPAAPVPTANCPLSPEAFNIFNDGLMLLRNAEELPMGYGAHSDEIGSDVWDEYEHIAIGSSGKMYPIELPARIWEPRMHFWVQALYVLDSILSAVS